MESASPGLQTQSERRSRIEQDEQLAKMIEEQGIFIFVQYWENITLFSSQKRLPKLVQEKVRQERLQQNPLGLANSLRGLGTGKQPSWWEDLSNLQVPTYIIVGGLDEKFKQIGKSMVEMLPQARLVTVPDAGHAIHVEKQGKFGTMIVDILLQKGGTIMAREWVREREYDEIIYETYNGLQKLQLTVRMYIMRLHQNGHGND